MLTFDPHPLEVLHPAALPKLIMPFAVKRDVIDGPRGRGAGRHPLRRGVRPPQRRGLHRARPDREARRRAGLGRRELPLRRQGARATRRCCAARPEFETRVVPLVEVDGETVSSTRIRALVAAGDMEGARHCLGAPFMVEGEVVNGDQRGRELGFPTANIVPDDRLVDPRPRRLRGLRQRRPGRRQRRRPADLRDRPRRPDRDLPDRPRRRPLRHRPCGSPSSSGCAARSASPSAEELIAQMRRDVEDAKRVCASFQRP